MYKKCECVCIERTTNWMLKTVISFIAADADPGLRAGSQC